MPRIFISTAEASAELHASRLADALFTLIPDMEIDAAGTSVLEGVGANIIVNMSGQAVMGFWEAISHLGFYNRALESIITSIETNNYDALVIVDAPSFHLHLAQKVHARWPDLPIIYYIAPKLWAWKKWRIKNMRRDISKTLCIFPFEEEFFQSQGVDAVYAGNPTLDQVRDLDGKTLANQFGVSGVKRHNEPERGLLAVFPGSRGSEVKYLWPEMSKAITLLQERFPQLKIAVALAPGWTRERLGEFAPAPDGIMYIADASQELLAASSAVLAKSGTTTLEAGLMGKPMVVCYAGDSVSFYIAKSFVKLSYISLPNILAGKEIVKELLQEGAAAEYLVAELTRIITDRRYYRRMRTRLLDLRKTLGDERAALRAAREIQALIDKANS